MSLIVIRAGTVSSGGKRPDILEQRADVVLSHKNIQVHKLGWYLFFILLYEKSIGYVFHQSTGLR